MKIVDEQRTRARARRRRRRRVAAQIDHSGLRDRWARNPPCGVRMKRLGESRIRRCRCDVDAGRIAAGRCPSAGLRCSAVCVRPAPSPRSALRNLSFRRAPASPARRPTSRAVVGVVTPAAPRRRPRPQVRLAAGQAMGSSLEGQFGEDRPVRRRTSACCGRMSARGS